MVERNGRGRFVKSEQAQSESVSDTSALNNSVLETSNMTDITSALNLDTIKRVRQQVYDLMSTVNRGEDGKAHAALREAAVTMWKLLGTHIYEVNVGLTRGEKAFACWLNFTNNSKKLVGLPFSLRLNDAKEIEPFMTGREFVAEERVEDWKNLKAFAPGRLEALSRRYCTAVKDDGTFRDNMGAILDTLAVLSGAKILGVANGEIIGRAGFQSWVYPTVVDLVPKNTYIVKQVRDARGTVIRDRRNRMVLEPITTVAEFLGLEIPTANEEVTEMQNQETSAKWMEVPRE